MIDTLTFQLPIKKFIEVMKVNHVVVLQKVAGELFNSFVKRTPIDTGRARSGWAFSIGSPSSFKPSPDAASYSDPAPPPLQLINGREQIWITNNVEYIPFLEQGTSDQAPTGMMAVSIAQLGVQMDSMIRQALGGKV